ncbi:MAG: Smr/MutS family protein [Holosporales bacterium]|jgi:DNA-nicking Smr family endonuclease|nr:Smr/MutS family protein [Holosporales bacterium]
MKPEDDYIWKKYIKFVVPIGNNKDKVTTKCGYKQQGNIVHNTGKYIDGMGESKNNTVEIMEKYEKRKFKAEAKLDLHGITRINLDKVISEFCLKCISENTRNIIIITGKGEGVTKKATLDWLQNSPEYVVSFSSLLDARKEIGSYIAKLRKRTIVVPVGFSIKKKMPKF